MSDEEIRCSFCRRTKEVVGMLIVSKISPNVAVCGPCLKRADGPEAYVSYCARCDVEDGQHGELCPEGRRIA